MPIYPWLMATIRQRRFLVIHSCRPAGPWHSGSRPPGAVAVVIIRSRRPAVPGQQSPQPSCYCRAFAAFIRQVLLPRRCRGNYFTLFIHNPSLAIMFSPKRTPVFRACRDCLFKHAIGGMLQFGTYLSVATFLWAIPIDNWCDTLSTTSPASIPRHVPGSSSLV